MTFSFKLSRELAASSSNNIEGLCNEARASMILCFLTAGNIH
ncbi:hypothetical protein CHCC20335_2296 [Bacillus paralicheniformis]|nr:hypothetical protein CHCC20335_2296 [Bacillus paralicheniformis]